MFNSQNGATQLPPSNQDQREPYNPQQWRKCHSSRGRVPRIKTSRGRRTGAMAIRSPTRRVSNKTRQAKRWETLLKDGDFDNSFKRPRSHCSRRFSQECRLPLRRARVAEGLVDRHQRHGSGVITTSGGPDRLSSH